MANLTVERYPFVGPFHNKPVTFMGGANRKSVIFSEGNFHVFFWDKTVSPPKRTSRAFTNAVEMMNFVNSG